MPKYQYPIVVIGAGAAGLVVTIGAAKAGKKVLLIDRGSWGGDCTNFGCIPSKSLIAAAHAAHTLRHADHLGLKYDVPTINAAGALKRARNIVAKIRHEEEPSSLKEKGIDTLEGTARFIDAHTIEVNGHAITAKNIVLATGSRPRLPTIDGLDSIPFLTNETIFDLESIPKHLAVLGGGPIGCEMAHAFRLLGSDVSLVQHSAHPLPRDEPLAQKFIAKRFEKDGINLYLDAKPQRVQQNSDGIAITLENKTLKCSHLLVATSRQPNIESLNLPAANIHHTPRGISTDAYGRTNQKNIWAAGDVAGRAQFTHLAENEARTILTNLLLPFRFKKDIRQPLPHVTFTNPEVAGFGLTEKEALEKYGEKRIATYHVPFSQLDRAITAGEEGFVHIVTKKWSSKILGACIVAPRAGEMLMELSTAAFTKTPLRKLSKLIHPYPIYNQAIRKAADLWLTQTLLPALRRK